MDATTLADLRYELQMARRERDWHGRSTDRGAAAARRCAELRQQLVERLRRARLDARPVGR